MVTPRNTLALIYNTMRDLLSEATGIPAKMEAPGDKPRILYERDPDPENINSEFPTGRLPMINIFRVTSHLEPNNYGDSIMVSGAGLLPGQMIGYEPAYDMTGTFQVDVYCESKNQKWALAAAIRDYFEMTDQYELVDDPCSGAVSMLLMEERDLSFSRPYVVSFDFRVQAQEFTARVYYTAESIELSGFVGLELDIDIADNNPPGSSDMVTLTPDGTTWYSG